MPLNDRSKSTIESHQERLLCANTEDFVVYGDFDSNQSQSVLVQFVKCYDRPDCKRNEEIIGFLQDKYLLMVYNEVRVLQND